MDLRVFDLGLVDFKLAWATQKDIFTQVKREDYPAALILCRHHPVITLGRRANRKNILATDEELKARGIEIHEVERGGDVTYHGPGQLIAYPIFNLNYFKKDIHWFLRELEEVVISLLSDFGIAGEKRFGLTGVWLGGDKIASIGIAIRNWITFHGLSLNVLESDLENFNLIKPCGMDVQMTSLELALCREISIDSLKQNLILKFGDVSQTKARSVPIGDSSPIEFRNVPGS